LNAQILSANRSARFPKRREVVWQCRP